MTAKIIFVSTLLLGMIGVLIKDRMRPGLTLFTVVVLMLVAGVIDVSEALAGFSNPGMITVGLLYLVSEGVSRSGALNRIAGLMLPSTKNSSLSRLLTRMLLPVAGLSAFLNNTPIVIIFGPIIKKWSEIMNISSKKLLIPLSFATILGGMCTVIGTTTNLVIDGMMISETGKGMSLFELGKVGLPIAIIGLIYIIFFSRHLLPGGQRMNAKAESNKEYYYDVKIPKQSTLIGQSIQNGFIDHLPDFRIVSLFRKKEQLDLSEHHILETNDSLLLAGNSMGLSRLMDIPGLRLTCLDSCDKQFRESANRQVEAVLAPRFPGIGKTLKQFDFLRHYGALVMSIHRNGERIAKGFDQISLREGDNLVLLTDETFLSTWGDSSVFYLLSEVGEIKRPVASKKKSITLILVSLMILGVAFKDKINLPWPFEINMLSMAAITAVVMAWSNIFPPKKYTKFISWDVMITIASAFAISKGIANSGLATFIAENTFSTVYHMGPHAVLAMLFVITVIFTEFITNNAAAAIVFPISLEVAKVLGVDPMPFFITICIAASASFLTPIGYQTNLIVQGIGNYKFEDYLKVGLPLTLIAFSISVMLIPYIWPF